MLRAKTLLCLTALIALPAPEVAEAQLRRTYWGISGGFTPNWSVPDYQTVVFDADRMDLSGSELRVGFVRGNIMADDWGVSFVRRDIEDRDAAEVKNSGTVLSTRQNTLIGVEVHTFKPFTTIKDRVQIGLSYGGGVGWYQQTIVSTAPDGASEILPANFLFSPGDNDIAIQPMGRLELAGAVILGPHVKVRVGGGISFPGQQLVSVTGVYLF